MKRNYKFLKKKFKKKFKKKSRAKTIRKYTGSRGGVQL